MSRIASPTVAFILADLLGCIVGAVAAVVMTEAASVAEAHAIALGRLIHFVAGWMIFLACLFPRRHRCRAI